VFATAPTFEPAVRSAVRATLHALARDPCTDEATRADVVAMLTATYRSLRLGGNPVSLS